MTEDEKLQKFLASRQTPFAVQPRERIAWLRERLEEPENQHQRVNILALIRMYESGELGPLKPGHTILICNGEIWDYPLNTENLPPRDCAKWLEGLWFQMLQESHVQAPIPPQSCSFDYHDQSAMHQIWASFRLITPYGGIPNLSIVRSIANDTGSCIQTLFESDVAELGFDAQTYGGMIGPMRITTPSGAMTRLSLVIEIQILNDRGEPMTGWYTDCAYIAPDPFGRPQTRLSGGRMREFLYFATAPGNRSLFVANYKNGIVNQLPEL